MKKRLTIVLLATSLFLAGCNEELSNDQKLYMGKYYTVLSHVNSTNGSSTVTFYCNETGVMYMIYTNLDHSSITPLYNPDGSLQVYDDVVEEEK